MLSLLPQLATAAAAGFSFEMQPQTAGNTAAMSGQRVIFDGAAPADATRIQSGEWLALDGGGNEIAIPEAQKEYVPSSALNAFGIELGSVGTQNDFIRIENGSFTGQLTLPPCTYSDPANGCAPEGVANAVLRLTVETAGGSAVGDSTPVPVDYTRPRIAGFEVIDTDRIRVVFSEAVRMPPGQVELATDWLVDDAPGVTAVEGEGDTRTLVLTQPVGEDETPMVEYINSLSAFPNRIPYIDAAGLRLQGAIGFGATESIDRIRPAKPNIVTVAGEAPSGGEVISSTTSPTVVLNNLTAGHTVVLSFTRNGTTTTMDAVEVPAGANSLELTPSLPADGTYVLSAVATDAAGNTSNQDDKNAARTDGASSVSYVLDTVAPEIDSAHFVNRRTVNITFTEPVAPANDAGQWMIGDDPATATGDGATRQLTAQVDTTSGAGVSWTPTDGSTYTDRAENTMVAIEGVPLTDLPAVPAPTVTTPSRELATTASKVTIAGTAPSDNQYLVAQLFERNGETPLMEASAADGTWTFEHTVAAEQRTKLQVRLRDTKTFVTSPRADVPDIVHDTKAPVVDVRLPADPALLSDPEQFGVGDSVTITWTATDEANDPQDPDHSRTASIFVDGAAEPFVSGIAVTPGTEQSFTYTLKTADLAGKRVRDIAFRVEVDDLAGNTGDDLSGTIRLLASTVVANPTVTSPARELFTSGSNVTISGTSSADSETNKYLDAQLFERGGDTPLATTSAAGGSWTFDHELALDQRDKRNELEVRLRDRDTGVTSRLVSVPDIVHDTKAPVVDVRLPASAGLLAEPEQFGVGDSVTITWTATDEANDPQDPDHSRTASIFVGGAAEPFVSGIAVTPGTEQSFTYALKTADLAGKRVRDIAFRVEVDDLAGNTGDDLSGTIRLLVSTTVLPPAVTTPAQEVFTSGSNVTISGTSSADSETNEYLDAQLFERGGDTPLATTSAAGGSWTFEHTPAKDQRSELQVRLRDRDTGIASRLVSVPDIVHDTTKPVVDVRMPASADLLGRPQEFGVGDNVTITWVATDKANDEKQPDHSKTASVFKVAGDTSTPIRTGIVAQPGQEQTVTYTLTKSDLGGQGLRDLTFRVDVADRADNIGSDVSATIRLLGDRVGYTPVLTAPDTIEVRFAEQLQGLPAPGDWTVNGQAALAEAPVDRNGTTVVVLHTPLETDPNATPTVQFTPTLPATQRLRSMNDSQITLAPRIAIDRTLPALTVQRPDTPDVVGVDRIRFTGTTDVTDSPNTIVAFYADAAGNDRGSAVASSTAGKDGAWEIRVPLVANSVNRIVFRAVDPSGNRSEARPSSPFTVTQDAIAPLVRLQSPRRGIATDRVLPIRWETVEANPSHVRVQYRPRVDGRWRTIAANTDDDGYFRWSLPKYLHADVFDVRVQAFDRTGKRDTAFALGLRGDFKPPAVRRAVSVGARSVRLFFTEPVYMPRHGFTVDHIGVRRVKHNGAVNTLILDRPISRTNPVVRYNAMRTRDLAGNKLAALWQRARPGFVFAPMRVNAKRINATRVRVEWRDSRNRPAQIKYYRIYRDGKRIGTVAATRRAFADTRGRGSSVYSVRAFDKQRRYSVAPRDYVR